MTPVRLALFAAGLFSLIGAVAGARRSGASARAQQPAVEEMRGMWVVRFSLSSPSAVRNIVATAKRYGFNTLFVQVRGRGDAWYHSDLEPRAEALADQPESFDPLALIIQEAHRNGIRVHAWINTYLSWTGSHAPKSAEHIVNAHPDWIARDRDGNYSMVGTDTIEGVYVQPSNPAVQDHLYRVFTDVARRYDVDGIHFDYVRYAGSAYDFSDAALERFGKYMEPRVSDVGRAAVEKDGGRLAYVHIFPDEWAQWRRDQVTNLVRRIADTVHRSKPALEVSAAVFPDASDAYVVRGQDWRGWLAAGYLDAVCPMAYSQDTDTVAKQIAGAVRSANGKHVYAGLGSYRISADSTVQKIARVRQLGVSGINLFSYDSVTKDGTSGAYLDYVYRTCFGQPAVAPRVAARDGRRGATQ